MNTSIWSAWRMLAYVIVQVVILLLLECVSKRRFPKSLWSWVYLQAGVVVLSSLADVVPHYLWCISLPRVVWKCKNVIVMLILLAALIRYLLYWREYRAGRWPN